MSLPTPDYAVSKLPEHIHQRVLLAALQVARPVVVDSKIEYIHTLSVQQLGGKIGMTVYLAGSPEPVDPSAVTIHTQQE